jgi:molybdopterin/thiamine biosynthesis adenylyltransferase
MFCKNIGALSEAQQRRLGDARVTLVGCGGIGGIALELLVRSGVGSIAAVDPDEFELTNMNRQVLGTFSDLGKPKAKVAARRAKAINPGIEARGVVAELDEHNATNLLGGADVVVDGLDNVLSRVVLGRAARALRIPYVFGAAERGIGMSAVFMPRGVSYEKVFALPSEGHALNERIRKRLLSYPRCNVILGAVANTIGCFEALQCVKLLAKKGGVVKAPEMLCFDAFAKNPFSVKRL